MNYLNWPAARHQEPTRTAPEAFPIVLKNIMPEIWQMAFQYLEAKDHCSVALTCRLWKDLTNAFFIEYQRQAIDCLNKLAIVCCNEDIKPLFLPQDHTPSLKMHKLNDYMQRNSSDYSFTGLFSTIFRGFESVSPNLDETSSILESMGSMKKILKNSNSLYIYNFPLAQIKLPGYRFIASKLNLGSNLVYSDVRIFQTALIQP